MKKVLFVCVGNASRSQMAEAFANHYGRGKIITSSAGTNPATEIDPNAVEVMKEKGIDISGRKPKPIDFNEVSTADVIVTMGCGAEGFCPATFLERVRDWNLDDPKGKPVEFVRKIRDEIEEKVKALIEELSG
jgi:protein-tyrosine-phosphatase